MEPLKDSEFDFSVDFMKSELVIPESYYKIEIPIAAVGGIPPKFSEEATAKPRNNQPPPLPTTIEEINADIARVYGGGNDLIGPDIIREDTYGKAFDLDGIYKSIDTSANKNDCLIHAFLLDVSPNFRKLTDAQKNEYADKWRRQIFVQLFDPVKESELRNEVTNMAFLSDVHLARLSKHFQINVLTFEPVATLGKVKAIYKITNPSNIAIIIYNPRDGHFRAVRKLPESKFIFTHGEAEDISDKYKEEDRTIFDCPYSEGELVVEIATGRLRRIALENKDTLGNNGKIRTTCIGFKFYDALKSPLLPLEEIRKVSVEDFTKMNKEDFDKFTEEDKQKLGEAEKQAYNTRQSAEFKLALSMPLPNSENEEQAPAASLSSAAASSAAAGLQRNDGHNVYFEEKEKAKAAAASASFPTPLVKGLINSEINSKEALARIKAGTASKDDFKTIGYPLHYKAWIEGTNDPEVYHDLATFYSTILPPYLYSEFFPKGISYEKHIIDNYIEAAKLGYKPSREKLDELLKLMKQQNTLDLIDYIYNSMLSEKILTAEEVAAAKAANALSSTAAAKANVNAALGVAPPPAPSASRSQAEVNEERRVAAVERVVKQQNPSQQDYENAKDYWENHIQENEKVYSNLLGVLYVQNLIEKELSEEERLDKAKRYFLASAIGGNDAGKDNLFNLGLLYFKKEDYNNASDILLEILKNRLYTARITPQVVEKHLNEIRRMADKSRGLKGGNRTRKVKRTS